MLPRDDTSATGEKEQQRFNETPIPFLREREIQRGREREREIDRVRWKEREMVSFLFLIVLVELS